MSKDFDDVAAGCLAFLGIMAVLLVFTVYLTVAGGVVLSTFWAWFLLPVFPNLPPLSLVTAMFVMLCLAPWIALFVGWIFKSLFM